MCTYYSAPREQGVIYVLDEGSNAVFLLFLLGAKYFLLNYLCHYWIYWGCWVVRLLNCTSWSRHPMNVQEYYSNVLFLIRSIQRDLIVNEDEKPTSCTSAKSNLFLNVQQIRVIISYFPFVMHKLKIHAKKSTTWHIVRTLNRTVFSGDVLFNFSCYCSH